MDNSVNTTIAGGSVVDYLDTYPKLSNIEENSGLEQKNLSKNIFKWLLDSGYSKEADRLANCGQNWLSFTCSKGHRIIRKLSCNLPYCPDCSKIGSQLNKKRSNRVKDILLGFASIGHYVFTLPKEISATMPDPTQINKLYKLAWEILRDVFDAEAVVIAIHFCGDKGKGLHIHFDCSYPITHTSDCSYPVGLLNYARGLWTGGINRIFKTSYLTAVTHYNFVNTLPQQHHLIEYVTRSTVPAEQFIELTDQEKEYCIKMIRSKVIRYFGKFVGKKKAEYMAKYKCLKAIERTSRDLVDMLICPICNEKMKPERTKEGLKRYRLDDLPLTQICLYNSHTYIDREIEAFLRLEREKETREKAKDLSTVLMEQLVQEMLGN